MEYNIEIWTLEKLLSELEQKKINLNPPYQRNPIWTKATQKFLINSIKNRIPIPNIFLHKVEADKYDMVDGQEPELLIYFIKQVK